ncbi:putative F-box protein At1g32420 [Bidens hawaiensis]|uniref:putative F-box protein At1g32420 n=1 Tax=Bidens hawaiensis TaxID=980011 RepID=UPI00404A6616
MSDHIPFEIQAKIMKRLPVRSLIQFRSVSKTWKSLIDSSEFVTSYSSQQKHMFIRYRAPDYSSGYVSVVDDHTFPRNRVSLTRPPKYEHYHIIGCCHGLLCFYNFAGRAAIWNPSTRRAYDVVPNVPDGKVYATVLGFGVCPVTKDPKIVKITYVEHGIELESISSIPFQVDVFMLSTWEWRTLSRNLPRSVSLCNSVEIDGIVYWLATDRNTVDGEPCYSIISFDITSEEFGEINLPNRLARSRHYMIIVSKLRESLVLVEMSNHESNRSTHNLWMMKGGLFTQLYTVPDLEYIIGFRHSGEPIIERAYADHGELLAYEPQSNHMDNLGFYGVQHHFCVHPYMETLLLHDHPNLTVPT